MAIARLSAVGSTLAAVLFAGLVPAIDGLQVAVLVGWIGVISLILGLVLGLESAIVFAAVLLMARLAMVAAIVGGSVPPLWIQVLLFVVVFELAMVSLDARTRQVAFIPALRQIGAATLVAVTVALALEAAVFGSAPGGLLLRIASVGALVVLVAWVVIKWAEAVE